LRPNVADCILLTFFVICVWSRLVSFVIMIALAREAETRNLNLPLLNFSPRRARTARSTRIDVRVVFDRFCTCFWASRPPGGLDSLMKSRGRLRQTTAADTSIGWRLQTVGGGGAEHPTLNRPPIRSQSFIPCPLPLARARQAPPQRMWNLASFRRVRHAATLHYCLYAVRSSSAPFPPSFTCLIERVRHAATLYLV
jgi:hypothetical protein